MKNNSRQDSTQLNSTYYRFSIMTIDIASLQYYSCYEKEERLPLLIFLVICCFFITTANKETLAQY